MRILARPEAEPKTPLAARLREIRKRLGYPEREAFCRLIGISKSTIAFYERGERTPDASVLDSYRARFGVNLNWLISGDGEMFEQSAPHLAADHIRSATGLIDAALLENLVTLTKEVHDQFGIKLPGTKATAEAAELYNELSTRVADLKDRDEIEANLPLLRYQLKKRLQEAAASPGTGKRQA